MEGSKLLYVWILLFFFLASGGYMSVSQDPIADSGQGCRNKRVQLLKAVMVMRETGQMM